MSSNKVLIQFGKNLAKYRKKFGISQEKLSILVGLHRTTVGEIERGEQNISLVNLVKIAGALEVKVINLLEDIEPEKVDKQVLKQDFNESLIKILGLKKK